MLSIEDFGFEDARRDLWSIDSVERLMSLRERVLEEQKKGEASPWVDPSIAKSYLRDSHCSAALSQLIAFLPQHQHARKALDLLEEVQGDDDLLAERLGLLDPDVPADTAHNPKSPDGKDRIRAVKTRLGQHAFRQVILEIYQNRCCVTGLDLPEINRASHIIGWAESKGKKIRMDPRNGLCLSATYDAAFDRHLITFDDDYRLVLSQTIKDHLPSRSVREFFLHREGQAMELPDRCRPRQEYLEWHRGQGVF